MIEVNREIKSDQYEPITESQMNIESGGFILIGLKDSWFTSQNQSWNLA